MSFSSIGLMLEFVPVLDDLCKVHSARQHAILGLHRAENLSPHPQEPPYAPTALPTEGPLNYSRAGDSRNFLNVSCVASELR